MKNIVTLASILLLSSSCVHQPTIQRPFSQLSVPGIDLNPISMEQVNSGDDLSHRERAKELGIAYVDYLHMVNNGKVSVTKSEPVIYHKHQ
jgi:hypothetical protein